MKRKLYFLSAILMSGLNSVSAQVPSYYPSTGLIEYYSFNDVLTGEIGSSSTDLVANVSPNFASGIFNGSSHRVYSNLNSDNKLKTNGNVAFPTLNNDFTVCFWFRLHSDNTASIFNYTGSLTEGNGGPGSVSGLDINGVYMTYAANNLIIGKMAMGIFTDFSVPYTFNSNWHHIALVHHSSGVGNDVLIDGVSVGAFDQSIEFETINHANSTLRIGQSPGETAYGYFDIDEFLIYDRIVSTADLNLIRTETNASVGIEEKNSNGITTYPNPSSGVLNIEVKDESDMTFSLYSSDNREVMTGELNAGQNTINIQELAVGTYFLKTTINGSLVTKKIVKQ